MNKAIALLLVIPATFVLHLPVNAGLTPSDVVVVYNSNWRMNGVSEGVATYYCAMRGIPLTNLWAIDVPLLPEDENVEIYNSDPGRPDFFNDILLPLQDFLSLRAGVPIGTAPDITTDPTKAIVLCYGIPKKVSGRENTTSTEGWLSMMFNETPWGRGPVGGAINTDTGVANKGVPNPYYFSGSVDPAQRPKPSDFSEFRESEDNETLEYPVNFKVVRMLSQTSALAGSGDGGLFRGEKTQDGWSWTTVSFRDKGFVSFDITDMSVVNSQYAWACTKLGTVLLSMAGRLGRRPPADTRTGRGYPYRPTARMTPGMFARKVRTIR